MLSVKSYNRYIKNSKLLVDKWPVALHKLQGNAIKYKFKVKSNLQRNYQVNQMSFLESK